MKADFGTKPYWACGLCKSLRLGTRPEGQDVGPQATAIMSGVFMVFVLIILTSESWINDKLYGWLHDNYMLNKLCRNIIMWVTSSKKVRETWGRTNVPHVPSALCTSASERCHVNMWGTFSNSLIFRVTASTYFINKTTSSQPTSQISLRVSPNNANSQSEGFGLLVRKERTVSP